ncbi:MAG: PilC/PilY family type IV pilus protein, partial [Betaproteobacteria bacterium]
MNSRHSTIQRAIACIMCSALVWAELALPLANAAATDIADVPMATRNRAMPNLIMAVDDSGSMDGEFSPVRGFSTNDGAAWWNTKINSFVGCGYADDQANTCADPTITAGVPQITVNDWNFNVVGDANGTWKKFIYLFPNGACGSGCDSRSYADGSNDHFALPPTREFAWFRSPLFNAQYYNPAITYDPWRPYNTGSGASVSPGTYDDGTGYKWNAVRSHPMYTGTTMDLTATMSSNATDKTFRMYPGMVLPTGAIYRSCTSTGNGTCSAWSAATTADQCYRNVAENCIFGSAFGAAVANLTIASNHLDVQLPYWPATVWVASTGSGALASDESWGPILPPATTPTRLRRVEIKSSVASYAKASTRTDCAGASTCTYAEEMRNFANWFAYYRKRHLYLNAATGIAFDQVTGIRVGQFRFNNRTNVTMYDFSSTSDTTNAKRLLYDLYRTKGDGGTPTRPSLEYAGKQYQRTGASAPINAACQYNGAFVITDGFANDELPATSRGNVDSDSSIRFNIPYNATDPNLRLATETPPGVIPAPTAAPPTASVTPAAPFPDSWSDTLGDVAMYYYSNNLRPDLTVRQVPLDLNDTGTDADRQDYLHMSTYALGLGVQGFIFNRTDSTALVNTNTDPYTYPPDWNANGDPTTKVRSPTAVDELWHATINSRGAMLSASSPEQARGGVVDIVNNVGAKGGAGAAVSVANPNLTPGDNFAYASAYNSGSWSGDINKYAIDLTTGLQSTVPQWNPSPQRQLANIETGPGDTRKRTIITYDGTIGQQFQWSSLTTTQRTSLNNDPDILDFLRGDRTKEVQKFRSRGPRPDQSTSPPSYVNNVIPNNISVLGSIINAEPIVVGPPLLRYFDQDYSTFKVANAARSTVVYQGANDGMLHAFDGISGAENWAYLPTFVYPNLRNLSDRNSFTHKYSVDGTPAFNDVDLAYTDPVPTSWTSDWRTILVGSLRKGGFGYYALDISNASPSAESTMTSRVLWEFPNASTPSTDRQNVGYTFGRPVIVKTRAAGWVVVVSSGYNNGTGTGSSGGDGVGRIWILNARTGAIIRSLSTGIGSTTTPSGLAHLSAFVERPDVDALVEAVYGGDLLGNLWRFDMSGTTTASWAVTRLTTLVDGSGNIQPITTEPELGLVNRKRMIYVGAGQYLGDTDVPGVTGANVYATRKMSFYGIRDDLSVPALPTPVITPLRSNLVAQVITKDAAAGTALVTSNAVDLATKAGWYMDFTDAGERSVTNPVLSGGVLS